MAHRARNLRYMSQVGAAAAPENIQPRHATPSAYARTSQPDRGRRDWSQVPAAQALVYGNRRRIRGLRGRRLRRRRGELLERSFAHYATGGMRRTHLPGHTNILKRLLIHAGGFNLGLLLRALLGWERRLVSRTARRPRRRRSFTPYPHWPRIAYCQSHQLVFSFGGAPFELLVFAVTLCRHLNRDLCQGLLKHRFRPPQLSERAQNNLDRARAKSLQVWIRSSAALHSAGQHLVCRPSRAQRCCARLLPGASEFLTRAWISLSNLRNASAMANARSAFLSTADTENFFSRPYMAMAGRSSAMQPRFGCNSIALTNNGGFWFSVDVSKLT